MKIQISLSVQKLSNVYKETASIPARLKGKFSTRLRTLEKKYGITRMGVSDKSTPRGDLFVFHYSNQPGFKEFKAEIHSKLWPRFNRDYPSSKKSMR